MQHFVQNNFAWITGAVLASIGIRVTYIMISLHYQGQIEDDYIGYYTSILKHGYILDEGIDGTLLPSARAMPIYPYFLAGIHWLAGKFTTTEFATTYVALAQSVIGGATVFGVGLCAHRINPKISKLAMVLTCVWPNFIVHTAIIGNDTVFVAFFVFGLAFLLWSIDRDRPWLFLVCSGIFFGLAILTRPTLVFFPVLLFFITFFIFFRTREFHWFRALTASLVVPLVMLALVSPRLAVNYHYYGKIALTSQMGIHALHWVIPCILDSGTCSNREPNVLIGKRLVNERLGESSAEDRRNPFVVDSIQRQVALEWLLDLSIKQIVSGFVGGAVSNLFNSSIQAASYRLDLPIIYLGNTAATGLEKTLSYFEFRPELLMTWLWRISLVGIVFTRVVQLVGILCGLWNSQTRIYVFVVGFVIAYFLVINGPIGNARYRLPMEPSFVVFTALGLHYLFCHANRLINKAKQQS